MGLINLNSRLKHAARMNSLGQTIFRIIAFLCIIFFLGMLYWSNVLIEEDLKNLHGELSEIKQSLGQRPSQESFFSSAPQQLTSQHLRHADNKYPNLLQEDPFYIETLPKLLGENFQPQGIRKEAVLGKPEHLHPFNGFKDVSSFYNLCSTTVADLQFGKYETLAQGAALKMEERPVVDGSAAKEFWIHLRNNLSWQPLKQTHFPQNLQLASFFQKKHPVTAYDFKFYYDAVMNPNISEPAAAALRNYLGDIEEFRVIDDLTFVIRWKSQDVILDGIEQKKIKYSAKSITGGLKPLPRFVFQYFSDGKKIIDDDQDSDTYRTNSVWAQNFIQHWAKNVIVSCGPWLFDGFSDQSIRFKRNPDYFKPLAALSEELHYAFKESFEGVWQDFKAGKVDYCNLAPSQLPELGTFLESEGYLKQSRDAAWEVKKLNYVDRAFYYIGWNESLPFFKNSKVRQALTMAIDRNRIIQQNLNEMGVTVDGPFFRYSPAYDPNLEGWPYDPYESKKILEKEGWIDTDGDGIRDKIINGKRTPFRFTLTYYVKNSSTKVIAEYVQTALKEIEVDCKLNGVDIADLSHTFEDKSFDAIFLGWSFGTPPEDPKQIWHSSGAKEKGSSNGIGFANPEIDDIIFKLHYEYDKKKRQELYNRFQTIIHEQAPYVFLYSPIDTLLYRNYVQNLFIPRDRQDLVPGADIPEPDLSVIWIAPHKELSR